MGLHRELDRIERRMLASHVRECEICRGAWRNEQRLLQRIHAIPDLDPPADLQRQLLAIPALVGGQPQVLSLPRFLMIALLALAGLLALGGAQNSDDGAMDIGSVFSESTPLQANSVGQQIHRAEGASAVRAPIARNLPIGLRTPLPPAAKGGLKELVAASLEPEIPAQAKIQGEAARSPQGGLASRPRIDRGESDSTDGQPTGGGKTAPQATATAPAACVDVALVVFADCPDCDGEPAPGLGLTLPEGMQVAVFDGSLDAPVLFEGTLDPGGAARIERRLGSFCGRMPLSVSLWVPDATWRACPHTGGFLQQVSHDSEGPVSFGLTRGCPAPTEAPPQATASPSPSATPSEPNPTATSAEAGPSGDPTERPPASETPHPTAMAGRATVTAPTIADPVETPMPAPTTAWPGIAAPVEPPPGSAIFRPPSGSSPQERKRPGT
jgi:hypothetical protein